MNVYVIYCEYRYHWTDRTIGLSLATVGLFSGLYGALLVKRAVGKLGERRAMTTGLIFGAIGWVMMGSSSNGLLMWAGIPILNLMAIVWPSAQSIMSREVTVSEQGQLQGAVAEPTRHCRAARAGAVYLHLQQVDWGRCGDSRSWHGVLCGCGDTDPVADCLGDREAFDGEAGCGLGLCSAIKPCRAEGVARPCRAF